MSTDRPDMTGALFRAREQKSENSPPYTGRVKIGGTEYRIAAWVKESDTAGKYFSIKVSEPDEQRPKPAPKRQEEDSGDDLPFK